MNKVSQKSLWGYRLAVAEGEVYCPSDSVQGRGACAEFDNEVQSLKDEVRTCVINGNWVDLNHLMGHSRLKNPNTPRQSTTA